ncbi:MAG: IPT/TIG domain-containing protein [Undibacterium sp.]|nr:IPT/TIG domain-containing protein [Opitutaceae bacterium]
MHTNRISLARKILLWLVATLGLALLSGCDTVVLTNLTAPSLPENPSQIYTFTLRVTAKTNAVVTGSLMPKIIVDGQSFAMKRSAFGEGIYEFEYQLPGGRDEVAYYFLVPFKIETQNGVSDSEVYTEIVRAKIVRRYVLSLEVNRGPIGARISILGRGFSQQDSVFFDNLPARTTYESPNAISFIVPAVEANKNYRVMLGSSAGNSPVGTFRVDPSSLNVSPSSLNLRGGERQTLTFNVPVSAPPGGLLIDITTDVPESVIMPEIIVPQGQTSVTITVEGGKAGNGSLFVKGFGAGEVTIPVSVTGK